jgi:hypothetical protein
VPRNAPLIKLEESSDDDLYRPTPPRAGDPGQGSSRWHEATPRVGDPGQGSSRWHEAPPPEDAGNSSDDDDGGDYTAFYRHFGM